MDNQEQKQFRPELRDGLAEYRQRHNLTLADLARELNSNASQVSQYLNGKPVGDVEKMEATIEDVLHNETRRKEAAHALFESAVTRSIRSSLEIIRETNDVGLIFGPAGVGKTCGLSLYSEANPTVILITATAWRSVASDVEGMLANAISMRGWKRDCKRGDYVCQRLQGSNRLIVVDNAHKLRPSGLSWLFDCHDATGCPLALVGNPEVLDVIRRNDQMFSRIGLKRELRVKPGSAGSLAEKIVEALVPEAVAAVRELVEVVAEKHGHFRAVRKGILLARKIRENGDEKNWAACFRQAHSQLVRDYAL